MIELIINKIKKKIRDSNAITITEMQIVTKNFLKEINQEKYLTEIFR